MLALLGPAASGSAQSPDADLTRVPLEQLMQTEVSAFSRSELLGAAAAVYVITAEDVRRSGATCIAEALRMAPGVEVARIDSNKWSVTIRGFAGRFANKLLVLIDGRDVTSPLFSGVFWDAQDVLLEDVERIEVFRGPGAATWGANAVAGVINVVTRRARDTRGVLVSGGTGSHERALGSVRVGARLGEGLWLQGYERYVRREAFASPDFTNAGDAWDVLRGGLRLDWEGARDELSFRGSVYDGNAGGLLDLPNPAAPERETVHEDISLSGGSALGRWRRRFGGGSELVGQAAYARTRRSDAVYRETRDSLDLDLRHGFSPSRRLDLAWGLGFRATHDDLSGSPLAVFDPERRSDRVWSGFVQGDLALAGRRLHLVLGSRFEGNDYTGFEAQPSLRAVWNPGRRWSAWAAVSRAFRRPSRAESDALLLLGPAPPGDGPPQLLVGNPGYESETLVAFDAGARLEAGRGLFLDLALYHADYADLRSLGPAPGFRELDGRPLDAVRFGNGGTGSTWGAELAAFWDVTGRWRLAAGANWLRLRLSAPPDGGDWTLAATAGDSPSYQAQLRSYLDLPGRTSLDLGLYQVGSRHGVPAHLRLDARLAFQPWKRLELSAGFQDLVEDRHAELAPAFLTRPALLERGAYLKLTLRY